MSAIIISEYVKRRANILYLRLSRFNKIHCVKSVQIMSYSGPYFPAFGLNLGRYQVSLHIHPKFRKIWTRITPKTDIFHAVALIFITLLLNCYHLDSFKWLNISLGVYIHSCFCSL